MKFYEIDWEFQENFAKIIYFIFVKFREIQNNFVEISCFAKFLKCCFVATLHLLSPAFCLPSPVSIFCLMSPVSRPLSPVSRLPCCKCFRFTIIDTCNDLTAKTLNFERLVEVLYLKNSYYCIKWPSCSSHHA